MKRRKFIKGSAILGASFAHPAIIRSNSGLANNKSVRKVYRILNANGVNVGTLPVLRAFAGNHLDYVSPYVLFDEFGPVQIKAGDSPLRVDAHPHAGVIPTTYFLNGNGHHKDSLNYDFQIEKGDFMMFSSGRGAIHMEESGQGLYKDGGIYHGFQIWLNMAAKYKFESPFTKVFNEKHMDILSTDNYEAKIILGNLFEAKADIELRSRAFYYHINLKENGRIDIPTIETDNAFIYIIAGNIELEGNKSAKKNQLVLFQRSESIINLYSECGAELLVLGGKPLDEPVYSYGPFVMNSEKEIQKCIMDYRSGKMGNPDLVN